jgi:GT2 family glycosyltransferase
MTGRAISHFLKAATSTFAEVIVIDNGSKELFTLSSDNRVKIIKNNDNLGFATAVNQGLELAQGEYILLLNSDVFINTQTLETMIEYAETHSDIGIIGPMMVFPDNSFQPSAGFFPTIGREILRFSKLGKFIPGGTLLYKNILNKNTFLKPVKVDWVSGGCMLIKKEVIEKVGMFDSRYFFLKS